jgi:RNA polymerase sigma-70 factor (ECF subfamily)
VESDEALFEQVVRGQTERLTELVERYQSQLHALALRLLHRRPEAEDAVQETFLRSLRFRHQFRAGSRVRPWLYQICLNVCRDQLRKKSRRPESELEDVVVADPGMGPEQKALQEMTARTVRKAVMELPDKHREVFILVQYQHMTYAEASEVLGLPIGTIKSRMFHASGKLAEALKELRKSMNG